MIDRLTTVNSIQSLEKPGRENELKLRRLKEACENFESLFIYQMLKSMRSAIKEEGFLGATHEKSIYYSMFDEKISEVVSKGDGIGLGRILFNKLKDGLSNVTVFND